MSEPSKADHAGEPERAELLALADCIDAATRYGCKYPLGPYSAKTVVAALRLAAAPPQPAPVEQAGDVVAWRVVTQDYKSQWFDGPRPKDYGPYEVAYTTPKPAPGFAEGFEAALKRELDDCQSAVATIEAHRDPTNETQNGNYRFYQGRVASLLFAIAALRSPAAPEGPKEVTVDEMRGLTGLERTLLTAAKSALNYIANTESDLGMTLTSGDLLRSAVAEAERAIFRPKVQS